MWHVALKLICNQLLEPSLVQCLWDRVTTDCGHLVLQQLAFSESQHFNRDIFPAKIPWPMPMTLYPMTEAITITISISIRATPSCGNEPLVLGKIYWHDGDVSRGGAICFFYQAYLPHPHAQKVNKFAQIMSTTTSRKLLICPHVFPSKKKHETK